MNQAEAEAWVLENILDFINPEDYCKQPDQGVFEEIEVKPIRRHPLPNDSGSNDDSHLFLHYYREVRFHSGV